MPSLGCTYNGVDPILLILKPNFRKMFIIYSWMFPSGASGDEVTVTGTGFDGTTKENNVVKIGTITCAVLSATDTEIKCTAGMGPAGPRTVWVSVIGKGAAKVDDSRSPFQQDSLYLFLFLSSLCVQ